MCKQLFIFQMLLVQFCNTFAVIPQRRVSLKNSSRGPFGLSGSLLPYVISRFFCSPLGTRLTYCGGGWWVVGRILKVAYFVVAYLNIGEMPKN